MKKMTKIWSIVLLIVSVTPQMVSALELNHNKSDLFVRVRQDLWRSGLDLKRDMLPGNEEYTNQDRNSKKSKVKLPEELLIILNRPNLFLDS